MDPPRPTLDANPFEDWVPTLLRSQHHRCALCDARFTFFRPPHLDLGRTRTSAVRRLLCMPCVRVLRLAGTDETQFPATVAEMEAVLQDMFDLAYCRAGPYAQPGVARSPHKIVVAYYRAAKLHAKQQTAADTAAQQAERNAWRIAETHRATLLLAQFHAGSLHGYQLCGRCNVPKQSFEFHTRRKQLASGVTDRPCRTCEQVPGLSLTITAP